jgi:polar amino acid transport system substrate-binding protein
MGVPSEDLSGSTVVGSYAESASAFFYKGSTGVVSSSDLNGKTVGVQSGSVSEQKLNKTTLGMSRQTFEDLNDAFEALESGSIDYVLCDAYAGAYVASSYDDIGFAGSLNDPSSYGIAIAASNTALKQSVQQALENVEDNGVYDAIRTRWVGSLPTLTSSQQISDIPTADADSSSTDSDLSDASEDISTETSEVDNAKDGSTAGSNAVIL